MAQSVAYNVKHEYVCGRCLWMFRVCFMGVKQKPSGRSHNTREHSQQKRSFLAVLSNRKLILLAGCQVAAKHEID